MSGIPRKYRFDDLDSCIITVPSVSRNAAPPFAVERQKMMETSVHSRQTISSTKVKSAQTVMTTIPKAKHTAVTMMAKSTQNNQLHHLHFLVCFHPHEMHSVMLFVVH